MRTLVLALCFAVAAATTAHAQTVQPTEAKAHVGETITVEGAVANVHTVASGVTFIDMGGHFPDNVFTAVILPGDAGKFPNVSALIGKTVAITGAVRLYQGKPEILLTDAAQLKAK